MTIRKKTLMYGKEFHSGDSDSILASLYSRILIDLQIDLTNFNYKLNKYFEKYKIQSTLNRATARNNLRNDLFQTKISFKTFIKGLVILDITEVTFTVKLKDRKGTITTHAKHVVLDNSENDDEVG